MPLLFITRAVRLFAYGFLALILWLYLAELGFTPQRIGLLLSMTMLGDVAVSLWITTTADRIGRKWMLILGAVLMALAGAVFLSTDDFFLLLIAATVGVISPSGNEVGPFLAIEQAALAQEAAAQQRTSVFAWYSLTGSLATAFGSLLCGLIVQGLHDYAGISNLQSYRIVLWIYAGVGVILAALFIRLSPAVEAAASPPAGGCAVPACSACTARRRGVWLAGLFALDAFAGGFVIQSAVVEWFQLRFQADAAATRRHLLGGQRPGRLLRPGGRGRRPPRRSAPHHGLHARPVESAAHPCAVHAQPAAGRRRAAFTILYIANGCARAPVLHGRRRQPRRALGRSRRHRRRSQRRRGPGAVFVGLLLAPALAPMGWLFILSGSLKLVYDGLVYWLFRTSVPPEEQARRP